MNELLTSEQIDRCQKFEWKKIRDQNPDMLECQTDGCDYLFIKANEDETYHVCLSCGVQYCLHCEVVYHVEESCEDYQARKHKAAIEAKANEINNNRLAEDTQLEEWAKSAGA